MPHPKSPFPTYRFHASSGHAVVMLVDCLTGKRQDVLIGEFGTPESRQRYDSEIAAWVARGRRLEESVPQTLSNNELFVRFLTEYATRFQTRGAKKSK